MSIEFACSQCGKLLRVGDDAAGKHARCPSCAAVQPVPARHEPASPVVEPLLAPELPVRAADQNPYQAPTSAPWYGEAAGVRLLQPTIIDAGDVLDRTWTIFKSQFAAVLSVAFVFFVCIFGFSFITGLTLGGLARRARPVESLAAQAFIQVIQLFFDTWLQAGLAIYMLKVARGEPASLADLFSGGQLWPKAVAARFIYFVVIILGWICFVVPGIIAALMFSQYLYLVVDRGEGPIESLSTSRMLTAGNKLNVFLLALSTFAVSLIGFFACCVGIVPAFGFINLMWAVAYLAMTGQPTADQLASEGPELR